METNKKLYTLDYMSLHQMGNSIKIIFPDGFSRLAQSVEEISFYDEIAKFEIVND